MENPKDPETLIEDLVVGSNLGEAQNPCDKTLELGSGLSGFPMECSDSVLPFDVFGDGWLVEESRAMGVNNVEVLDQGMMDNTREGIEVTAEGLETNGLNSVEEGLQGNPNVEVVVSKPHIGEGTEEGNVSRVNEVNPACNKEATEDGTSLFMEVFGQSNESIQGGEVDFGGALNDGMNGALIPEIKEKPSSDAPEIQDPVIGVGQNGAIGDRELVFAVGDLIWVETKTPSWWPGLISDPSNAPEHATKPDDKFDILVKCFGNDSYVWCSKPQLKPFFENFEQLSLQSNSKVFISSIEKAVDEFVRRVKSELTCSCNGGSTETKISRSGETFSTQFESADFLGYVKDLALRVSVPDVFEYVVTQNRLSAFYRSVGHIQMPVRQLWETNYLNGTVEDPKDQTHHSVLYLRRKLLSPVTPKTKKPLVSPRTKEKVAISGNNRGSEKKVAISEDKKRNDKKVKKVAISENNGWCEEKSEKGYESRERRRSKYLSPPYVSLAPKDLPISEANEEGINTVSQVAPDTKSIAVRSEGSSSLIRSRGKKPSKKEDSGHKVSISRAEIDASSSSDMVSELRLAAIDCLHRGKANNFDSVDRFFCVFRRWAFHDETKPEMDCNTTNEVKESKEPLSDTPTIATPVSADKNTQGSGQPLPSVKPKRHRRTKKEIEASRAAAAGSQNGPGFPDANRNPTNGSFIINFQEGCLVSPNSESLPKKRKENNEEAPELLECNIEVALPDLNGNFITPSSLLQASSQPTNGIGPEPKKKRKRRTKAEMAAAAAAAAAALANGSGISGNFGPSLGVVEVNSGANGEPKKRKRRAKGQMDHPNNEIASAIPDLNGGSSVNLAEANSTPASGEPQRKRRRRRNTKTVPVSGASLLLRFAPGFPVPSKDALVATFCGFGPLMELETGALSDPGSAQVVFVNSSGAAEAFQSLEKCSPFGPALIGYNLHHVAAALSVPVTVPTVNSFRVPAKSNDSKPQSGESPDLSYVRKNLERMTSMLEKAGDDLSPETRAKLEGEVKGLLKKVSSLVGSSSSSSS